LRRSLVACVEGELVPGTRAAEDVAHLFMVAPSRVGQGGPTREVAQAVVDQILAGCGHVARCANGAITASWDGGGEEDVLAACLAAEHLVALAKRLQPDAVLHVGVDVGDEVLAAMAASLPADEPVGSVYLGTAGAERVVSFAHVEELAGTGLFRLVRTTDAPDAGSLAGYDEA